MNATLSKVLSSLGQSLDKAANWFVGLNWYYQLTIAMIILIIFVRIITAIMDRLMERK